MGMIKTFSLITTYGGANPVILTEGITVSLLTTQAGLLVAFPCMLLHNYIKNRRDALVQRILSEAEAEMKLLAGNGDCHVQ
jgi:biopolymer transport protein ExbB